MCSSEPHAGERVNQRAPKGNTHRRRNESSTDDSKRLTPYPSRPPDCKTYARAKQRYSHACRRCARPFQSNFSRRGSLQTMRTSEGVCDVVERRRCKLRSAVHALLLPSLEFMVLTSRLRTIARMPAPPSNAERAAWRRRFAVGPLPQGRWSSILRRARSEILRDRRGGSDRWWPGTAG
jgi:hypothetical protein